jgi:5-methylcytosine-specific restriction endonuclease McrA
MDSDEQVMMEPFPSTWKDTPKKRAHWAQMQRNNAFLCQQKCLQCHYCHKAVRIAHWSENYIGSDVATVDHVVPLARGGTDHPSNLVVACRPCNMKKGHS